MSGLDKLVNDAPVLAEDGSAYVHSGNQYERVTSIVHRALPPYLAPWAEKVGQQAALTIYKNTGTLPDTPEELKEAVKMAGLTTDHEKKAGGLRGAEIHFALGAWIDQGLPPTLSDFEPEVRPYAQTLARWLMDYEPEFAASEVPIYHPEYGYAGTLDAIGVPTKRPKGARHPDITGKICIFDLKTNANKAVYEQHYAQTAAYQLALDHHGIATDNCVIVAIGPSPGRGTPYRNAVSFWDKEDWIPVVNLYKMLEQVKQKNPNARKPK